MARSPRRVLGPTQCDLMMAAASHCRAEACSTLGEAPICGELSARLNMVLAAIDDLMELSEMAGNRGHLRPEQNG